MIRQSAFTGNKKLLKGAIHCHTTRSDGDCSPEETMQIHADNNYDFLAITDHRQYNYKTYLPESGITIIPGMEIDATFDREIGFRTYHTVCLGPDDETNGFAQDEKFVCENVKTQEDFQKYLDIVHAKNNITFYCHPEWSGTPPRYFDRLQGNFAMEIWNSGGADENFMDTNALYWDDMLGMGHKLWGVAVDDGHQAHHHGKGWVMVNADNDVKSILEALTEGRFYSSCGPVIKDFYVEDGKVYIETEGECAKIWFSADAHPNKQFENTDHAEADLRDDYVYVRAIVMDKEGRRAWTNPIFIK